MSAPVHHARPTLGYRQPAGAIAGDRRGLGEADSRASRLLEEAGDALDMAILVLDGDDRDRSEQRERAVRARGLLVEAVTALARARVYVAGVRTYAVPVILAVEDTTAAELARLNGIARQLLWWNHQHLPAKALAIPLSDEEERQLAQLLDGISRQNRIERAMRYKWLGSGALLAVAGAAMGPAFIAAGVTVALISAVQLARTDEPAVAVGEAG